jgi:hypothetical protein
MRVRSAGQLDPIVLDPSPSTVVYVLRTPSF